MATAIVESWATAITQSTDLCALEKIVEKGKSTFVEVGMALLRIHDAELYKSTHSTWQNYCQQRWGWSRQHCYRLMGAAELVQNNLSPVGDTPRETHIRPLVGMEADAQRELYAEALASVPEGERLTAAHVEAVVTKAKPPSIQNRRTPKSIFDALNALFGPFLLDAYAEPHNALCERFLTKEQDGNTSPWVDVTFGNPEFKKGDNAGMALAVQQAVKQAGCGIRSCIIGPAICSQDWAHEFAIRGTIWLPDHRISYDTPEGDPTDGADRDSVVMTFGREHTNPDWQSGKFLVRRLELDDTAHPATEAPDQDDDRVESPDEDNA
jgi:phage N-6-adenine-methyltransferase